MPQKQMEIVEEVKPVPVVEEKEEEPVIPSQEPVLPEQETLINEAVLKIMIVVALTLVVSAAGVITFLLVRRKKNRIKFESIDESMLKNLDQNISDPEVKTEMIHTFRSNDDGHTYMIWNEGETYHVVLTDVNSPMKSFQVPFNQSLIIGRKRDQCDIILDYDKSVSGKHCQIDARDGKFYICDLQSANGTYVNGSKVLSETELFSGNIIKMGRLQMRFEVR